MSYNQMDILKSVNVSNLNGSFYHVDLTSNADMITSNDDNYFYYLNNAYHKCTIIIDNVSVFKGEPSSFYNLWLLLSYISCKQPIDNDFTDCNVTIEFSFLNYHCIYKIWIEDGVLKEKIYSKESPEEDFVELELGKSSKGTSCLEHYFLEVLGSLSLSFWQTSYDFSDTVEADKMIDKHFECQNYDTMYFEALTEVVNAVFPEITLIVGVYYKSTQSIIIHKDEKTNSLYDEQDIDIVNFIMMYADYFIAVHVLSAPLIVDLTRCNDLETINNWILLSTKYNSTTQMILLVNKSFDKIQNKYDKSILPIININ